MTEIETVTHTQTETQTETAYYAIAQLNSVGKRYWLTADVAQAWRFADGDAAQETAGLINSIPGNGTELHVTELDGEGPPLTLQ